jgi:molybdopterin converting factor small subunit
MARVVFTSHLQRFVECPEHSVDAASVRAALGRIFEANPRLRDYIVDEQECLRKHVVMFVDGRRSRDLDERIGPQSEVYVLQALSGG